MMAPAADHHPRRLGGSYSGMGGGCPAYSSAGCCPDDGTCCDCVGDGLCSPQNATPTGAEAAFDECACKQCASECAAACAGGGIDDTCPGCVAKAAKGACASQYAQCPCAGPNQPFCGVTIGGAGGSGTGGQGGTGGA